MSNEHAGRTLGFEWGNKNEFQISILIDTWIASNIKRKPGGHMGPRQELNYL